MGFKPIRKGEIFWMNNNNRYQIQLSRMMWRIMLILEDFVRLRSSAPVDKILLDLNNSSHHTQPHSIRVMVMITLMVMITPLSVALCTCKVGLMPPNLWHPNLTQMRVLLSFRARSCLFSVLLAYWMLRTHLFLSCPENSCSPISAMTPRKNINKIRTSLNSFREDNNVFTTARRP